MNGESSGGNQDPNSFAALRRLVRPRRVAERCDVCGAELPDDHAHLVEPETRQIICSCDECLVSVGEQSGAKYRRIPRHSRILTGFRLSEIAWDNLLIPVGMAFFFYSSPAKRVVAFYPSPAGATESQLSLDSWEEVVRDNPVLQQMQPDVVALLVNRIRGTEEYYLAPIDRCYELVGLIRSNWRGLSGGAEVWREIARFFAKLKAQAVTPEEDTLADAELSG